jgi:ABC-type transport system involved in multi-copper enzyme maturation permease subunit
VPPILTIARLTILEASRRWLLLALLVLTLVVIGGTGYGFSRLWTISNGGQPLGEVAVHTIASQLLILIAFVFAAVLALSSTLVASPSISGDVESGQVLALLSRPVRRSELVLGKWLGLAVLVLLYSAGAVGLEMIVTNWVTGYLPPHPIQLIAYIGVEGLVLLSLALLMSTRLAGMTGGIIALVMYFIAWIGGIVGGVGTALNNDVLTHIGTASKLLLPTDLLWRGAVYALEPASIVAGFRTAGRALAANPFAATDPPPPAFLLWVVAWLALMVGLTIWSFRRREL